MPAPHFRYSLSPPVELEVPRLVLHSYAEREGDRLNWFRRMRGGGQDLGGWSTRDAPVEFHLRELVDFDAADPDQLIDFVRRFGDPTVPISDVMIAAALTERRCDLPYPLTPDLLDVQASLRQLAHGVMVLRLMVDHTAAALASHQVAPLWQKAGAFELTEAHEVLHEHLLDVDPEKAAWMMFAELLNAGLPASSPRIAVAREGSSPRADSMFAVTSALIFNDLLGQLPYRECADETCRRRFRRQIGRAQQGGSRRDARFCCPQHARSQSQRERRRAARVEKVRNDRG